VKPFGTDWFAVLPVGERRVGVARIAGQMRGIERGSMRGAEEVTMLGDRT
jgi:hypothetical protein